MAEPLANSPPSRSDAGVLPHQDILEACDFANVSASSSLGKAGPIRPCERANVRSASYDLRLGSDFYMREEQHSFSITSASTWPLRSRRHPAKREIQKLDQDEALVIPPNGVTIITAEEQVHFDDDLVGRLSLKMDFLLKGLIMASQGQMDAGYRGHVFALLYNLSDREITIRRGDSILRLELVRLHRPSSRPYNSKGDYQDKSLGQLLMGPVGSSLQEMREAVENTEVRVRNTRVGGAGAAIFAAAVPILVLFLVGVFGSITELRQRTSKLEGSSGVVLTRLTPPVDVRQLCREVRRLERRLKLSTDLDC